MQRCQRQLKTGMLVHVDRRTRGKAKQHHAHPVAMMEKNVSCLSIFKMFQFSENFVIHSVRFPLIDVQGSDRPETEIAPVGLNPCIQMNW